MRLLPWFLILEPLLSARPTLATMDVAESWDGCNVTLPTPLRMIAVSATTTPHRSTAFPHLREHRLLLEVVKEMGITRERDPKSLLIPPSQYQRSSPQSVRMHALTDRPSTPTLPLLTSLNALPLRIVPLWMPAIAAWRSSACVGHQGPIASKSVSHYLGCRLQTHRRKAPRNHPSNKNKKAIPFVRVDPCFRAFQLLPISHLASLQWTAQMKQEALTAVWKSTASVDHPDKTPKRNVLLRFHFWKKIFLN